MFYLNHSHVSEFNIFVITDTFYYRDQPCSRIPKNLEDGISEVLPCRSAEASHRAVVRGSKAKGGAVPAVELYQSGRPIMVADVWQIMSLLQWFTMEQAVFTRIIDGGQREFKLDVKKVCALWYDRQGHSWGMVKWKRREHPDIVYGSDFELEVGDSMGSEHKQKSHKAIGHT